MQLRWPLRVFCNRSVRIAILLIFGAVSLIVLLTKIQEIPRSQDVQLAVTVATESHWSTPATGVNNGTLLTPQPQLDKPEELPHDVQLLYLQDSKSRNMLKQMQKSGKLLELARTMNDKAEALTEHYPYLTLNGHKFWTLDGRSLSAANVLNIVVNLHRSEHQPIPNVIHMFMFSTTGSPPALSFHVYLSFLGAFWLSGVDTFILWCNIRPTGHYWMQFVRNITAHGAQNRLIIASRPVPTRVFTRPAKMIQHQVDLMKLQTAIIMGGIFLDSDSLTLRSLQPLRRHDCVMGRETYDGLSIGTLMSKPSSRFVLIWYMLYQTFKDEEWAIHSIKLPEQIWRKFPSLCHVENDTMTRPNWREPELSMLYKNFSELPYLWNWNRNYIVHLWKASRPNHNEVSVRTLDSMFGELARHVLYGTKNLLLR